MDKIESTDSRVNQPNAGRPWKGSLFNFIYQQVLYSKFIFVYFLESLFGCFDDINTCLCGFFCLPCLFGQNVEKIDGSNCVGCCLAYWCLGGYYLCWIPHLMKRKVLRQKYLLKEEPCNDCLTTAFCGPCAVCQEARELNARSLYQQIFILYRLSFVYNSRWSQRFTRTCSTTSSLSEMKNTNYLI